MLLNAMTASPRTPNAADYDAAQGQRVNLGYRKLNIRTLEYGGAGPPPASRLGEPSLPLSRCSSQNPGATLWYSKQRQEDVMGGVLLWLIGIPIPLIIILYLIF